MPLIRESGDESPLNYKLKKHARIILRITQAWFLLLIIGSLQPARPGKGVTLHYGIHWLAFAGTAFLLLLSPELPSGNPLRYSRVPPGTVSGVPVAPHLS